LNRNNSKKLVLFKFNVSREREREREREEKLQTRNTSTCDKLKNPSRSTNWQILRNVYSFCYSKDISQTHHQQTNCEVHYRTAITWNLFVSIGKFCRVGTLCDPYFWSLPAAYLFCLKTGNDPVHEIYYYY